MRESPRIADLLPQDEGIDGSHRERECRPRECRGAVTTAPGEDAEPRKHSDAGDAREDREPRHHARAGPAPALRECERREREREEERLAVDGLEKERHREQGELEDGAARAVRAECSFGRGVQEDECSKRRGERNDDAREHVVAEEDMADEPDERWIERPERGRRVVVRSEEHTSDSSHTIISY